MTPMQEYLSKVEPKPCELMVVVVMVGMRRVEDLLYHQRRWL
jgi:hypothetical protein